MSENTDREQGPNRADGDRTDEQDRSGQAERAERTTDKTLHVHPDEATGEIDPFDEDGTVQTPHGLTQKGDETTR
jgi:hypothetical protein